jgi:hypothetical protein
VNRRFILTSEFFLLRCYSNSLPWPDHDPENYLIVEKW